MASEGAEAGRSRGCAHRKRRHGRGLPRNGRFSDRFEREAKAIASLNHPDVCTLYDLGPNYLVMEFVEGDTLAHAIKQGPMRCRRRMRRAWFIGSGAKVLDFGLAKLGSAARRLEPMTESGSIVGSRHHMAPEQAEGKDTVERSDTFLSARCCMNCSQASAPLLTARRRLRFRRRFWRSEPRGRARGVWRRNLQTDGIRRTILKQTLELIDVAGVAGFCECVAGWKPAPLEMGVGGGDRRWSGACAVGSVASARR
jgi:serine/threonine protein kinase